MKRTAGVEIERLIQLLAKLPLGPGRHAAPPSPDQES
jgi:hypothetical protein